MYGIAGKHAFGTVFAGRFGPAQAPADAFRLPVAKLELVFRCRDACWLPPSRGALWRSVLGPQLAHAGHGVPANAPARRIKGQYARDRRYAPFPMPPDLFDWLYRTSQQHCLALPEFGQVPHPLSLECSSARDWEFVPPGHTLRIQITLAGRLIRAWKTLLLAFANAGSGGIGKAISLDGQRGRAELMSAHQVWRMYQRPDLPVFIAGRGFCVDALEASLPSAPAARPVRVTLASPLRLERGGRLAGPDDFRPGDLVAAMSRKAGALMASETGRRAEFDFGELKSAWQSIAMKGKNLRWARQTRWSASQERQLPLDGITGSFEIDPGEYQPLFDLLWLAQWLGVGKGTMMGLGSIRLSALGGQGIGSA